MKPHETIEYVLTEVAKEHKTGRDNSRLLDKENWLPVCRNCHEFITKNSKQAIELGLSKRRIT